MGLVAADEPDEGELEDDGPAAEGRDGALQGCVHAGNVESEDQDGAQKGVREDDDECPRGVAGAQSAAGSGAPHDVREQARCDEHRDVPTYRSPDGIARRE